MNCSILKNPLHLFRKDGITLGLPLFKVTVLERDLTTIKNLNTCVGWRHMLVNKAISELPKNLPEIVHRSFYYDLYLDFRPEHPFVNGPRYQVLTESQELNPVLLSYTRRKFKKILELVLEKNKIDKDFIFSISNHVFYTGPNCIEAEIEKIIKLVLDYNSKKQALTNYDNQLSSTHNGLYLDFLERSNENGLKKFGSDMRKIHNEIITKESFLGVLFK